MKSKKIEGFTLIEILIAGTIVTGIVIIIGTFSLNILDFRNFLIPTFRAQQEMQIALQNMSIEILSMALSNIGGYPISQAGTSTITFFSDIDNDGLFEQVRYFLSGTTLKKGVLKPSGNPLSYISSNERISDIVHYIYTANPVIFTYYESGYFGTELSLPHPINISKIRLIGVNLSVKNENMNSPVSFNIKVTPRNLRTN